MFVLCELRNRAETVDTILLFASNKKEVLEEKIFNDLWTKEQWAEKNDYPTMGALREWCQERMKNYHIIEIPYVEGQK